MTADPSDGGTLQRFVEAQGGGVVELALEELRRGRKTSHWMWFVFPQLAGLGTSGTAVRYAVSSFDEARAYLGHPVLGARLRACHQLVADSQVADVQDLLGDIDALKLHSSATLFDLVAEPGSPFAAVLARWFGGRPDVRTLALTR